MTPTVELPKGLKVFPVSSKLKPNGKKDAYWVEPIEKATDNPQIIQKWMDAGYLLAAPVGYKWGVFGIDVDPAEGAEETLEKWETEYGELPETWACSTPHEGWHLLFQTPSGTSDQFHTCTLGNGWGAKLSDNQYIIVAGGDYKQQTDAPIAYAPAFLVNLLVEKSYHSAKDATSNPDADRTPEEEIEFAEYCLGRLSKHRADDYQSWVEVGMALSTMQDKDKALKLFKKFSSRSEKYNEGECDDKWETFHDDGGLTLGSLSHWADEDTPPTHVRIGKEEAKELDREVEKAKEDVDEDGLPELDTEATELGNSKRLIALHGHEMLWCEDEKSWYVWNGKKWETDRANKVLDFAEDVVKVLLKEAIEAKDSDERRKLAKHALVSQTQNAARGMLFWARTHSVNPDDFDLDNELLNCNNGIINMRTGELLPHDPKYMMRKIAPFDYDPNAKCPKWLEFLRYSQDGDEDTLHWVQKALGLSASGRVDKILPFLFGEPNCGKSTLSETMLTLLGDYADKTNIIAFSKNIFDDGGDKPNSYVAGLKGKRLVIANETRKGGKLDTALLKDISGMDTLTNRRQYGAKETFMPTHTLWIYGNDEPDIRDSADDDAFIYRLCEVPFHKELPKPFRPMEEVKAEYLAEASGILAWLVTGFQMWLVEGATKTERIDAATKNFQQSQDTFAIWLDEEYERGDDFKTKKSDLVKAFNAYLLDNGERKVQITYVSRRMTTLGFEVGGNGKSMYIGLRKANEHRIGIGTAKPAPKSTGDEEEL